MQEQRYRPHISSKIYFDDDYQLVCHLFVILNLITMSYNPQKSRASTAALQDFVAMPILPTTRLTAVPSIGPKTEDILNNNDIWTCPDLFFYYVIDLKKDPAKLHKWLKRIGCPASHVNTVVHAVDTKMATQGHLFENRPTPPYVKSDPPAPYEKKPDPPPIIPRGNKKVKEDEKEEESDANEDFDEEEDQLATWFASLTYAQKLYMKRA